MTLASALLLNSCITSDEATDGSPISTTSSSTPTAHHEVKPPKSPGSHTVQPQRPQQVTQSPVTPKEPAVFTPKMPGKRVAQVNVPGPYVALTFDDGPSPAYTPKVLDILKRHNAKATFFVLGQLASRHKGILARATAEGHEIAAHTWSHINMPHCSDEKIISEMDRTNSVIAEATGRRPAVMRPPYGATNSRLQDLMMSRYGMASILWSVDTQDWRHPGVDVVISRCVNGARNGSIILLHDIHASTLAAVEGVVTGLQKRGFTLVTVSELMEMGRKAAGGAQPTAPAPQPAPAALMVTPVAAADTAADASPQPTPEAQPAAPAEKPAEALPALIDSQAAAASPNPAD